MRTLFVHFKTEQEACHTLWSSLCPCCSETYWMKPAWRSCLAFCSRCFSCSSCLLYLFTLFSRSSSLCLAWSIISRLLRSSSSAESFLHQTEKTNKLETLLKSTQCGWWFRQCSEKQITISKAISDYLNSSIVVRVSIIKLWELHFCCVLKGNFWHIFSFIKLGFRAFLDINKTPFEGFVYVSPVYPAPWSEP